jgi:DNA-directed RNA polymerase specialized sigma24 family protein
MSYKEIGEAMGLPDTTIETRIARARRMLRERAEAAGVGMAAVAQA